MNKKIFIISSLVMILLMPCITKAYNFVGYVTDEDGDPMPYTSVYVKDNPYVGVMTDDNGRYEIEVDMKADGSDNMVFSFIGYKTEEVPIKTMQMDSVWYVTLIEQPIMLDGATVMKKISRRESRKIKKQVLERFIDQLAIDFPKREVDYPVFSMYDGKQSGRSLIHHEIIGVIKETPLKARKGGDSVALAVNKVNEYTAESLEEGYEKFNEMADENINTEKAKKAQKKKKKNKKPQLTYTKRSLDDQALRVHRFLWGGPTGSIVEMVDTKHAKKWDYTMIGNDNVLTYTENKNFLGIVKVNLQIHFYIDPSNYSVDKIAQSLEGELHIPFGYKLNEEMLDLINTIQMGYDTIEKYRARHAYVDVKRNVFLQRRDGYKVVREKNLDVKVNIISNKKQKLNYSAKAKAIVSGKPKVKEKKK